MVLTLITSNMSLQYNALLGNLGSWHSCGFYLSHTSHPNMVADQVRALMAAAFPNDRVPQQHHDPVTQQKLLRNLYRIMTELKLSTWPPNASTGCPWSPTSMSQCVRAKCDPGRDLFGSYLCHLNRMLIRLGSGEFGGQLRSWSLLHSLGYSRAVVVVGQGALFCWGFTAIVECCSECSFSAVLFVWLMCVKLHLYECQDSGFSAKHCIIWRWLMLLSSTVSGLVNSCMCDYMKVTEQ